jgi:hypothetical protein
LRGGIDEYFFGSSGLLLHGVSSPEVLVIKNDKMGGLLGRVVCRPPDRQIVVMDDLVVSSNDQESSFDAFTSADEPAFAECRKRGSNARIVASSGTDGCRSRNG